ncbi:hypothetical protein ACTWQL_00485 [Pseudalkalibacillus sp. R45]|uniref:hypothetical protein n=1 Tax=Pseudalkalibacillus sp. R45 TaxID=3457433 RepID=UPI003FCCD197
MNEQLFIDVSLTSEDSLAEVLSQIVDEKREESGSYDVTVHNVIPVGQNRFTVILNIVVEGVYE